MTECYPEEVKADDVEYESDRNVIVALSNRFNMVEKRAVKKPTRESIAATAMTLGRRKRLTRGEVVNSPF